MRPRRLTVVCGTLIAPVLERLADELAAETGVGVGVRAIRNDFFGPRVNVSGLLVARDIESQLRGADPGDIVVLPRYALDYTGMRFLDDVTPGALQSRLGARIAFASTMREVLQICREGVSSDVTGAGVGSTTNGKSWVDYGATEGGEIATKA